MTSEKETKNSKPGILELALHQYEIRARVTCPRTGHRKEIRRVHECSGIKEAQKIQHDMRTELEASLKEPEATETQRLRDFAASWLDGRKDLIKETTARKIAMVFDEHIAPTKIADLRIDKITSRDVADWRKGLQSKTTMWGHGKLETRTTVSAKSKPRLLSKGTIKGYYRVLSQIIKVATAQAGVRNPCEGVEKLKRVKAKRNYLNNADLVNVLAHVRANSPDWYTAVLLDVFSGLRWGELSALRWGDIDETERVIRVVRNNDKGRMVDSTKTGDDEDEPKIIPLLPVVLEALRERRKAMIGVQHPGLTQGWIFPTAKGALHKGSPLRDVLDAACAACKTERRITVHGLRHIANNLILKAAGGEVARAIVGHSTEEMTHHYSHVEESEKHAAVNKVFDTLMGTKRGGGGVAGAAVVGLSIPGEVENPAIKRG